MKRLSTSLVALGIIAMFALAACSNDDGSKEPASSESGEAAEAGEDGEESGTQFGPDDTYDEVRAGARLVLTYDETSNSFTGTVENTTDGTLEQVRVEVHLSDGTELGPTTPIDLEPGQVSDFSLRAITRSFDTWSAHPEVGGEDGEHDGGAGSGEHD